jgi:hypothetical protein
MARAPKPIVGRGALGAAPLAWCARHGSALLAASIFGGILLPPLAAAFRPAVTPAVAALMTLVLLRIDPGSLLRTLRQPVLVAALSAWVLLACPLLAFAATRAAGLDGPLGAGLVLMAASCGATSAPAFARLVGLDAELCLVVAVATTALLPFTAPPLALGLLGRRGARGERVAVRDGLVQPALQLGGAQLERVDGLHRLGGDARMRLLGCLGPARTAVGEHGPIDDPTAGRRRLRRRRRGRLRARLHAACRRGQRGACAARPLEPQRLGVGRHELGGHEVRAAPRGRVAAEARVGERLEAMVAAAGAQQQRGQLRCALGVVGPAAADAHEPAVGTGGQPLDRLEREPARSADRRGGRLSHVPDGPRPTGGKSRTPFARSGDRASRRIAVVPDAPARRAG